MKGHLVLGDLIFRGLWINLSCGQNMDKILWQTLGKFDLVHSSYKWILSMLFCGKHSRTVQAWIISRLWFCRRPSRLKINIRENPVYLWKSHVCANKMDVQETNFSFTRLYRSWNNFSQCRFTHGLYSILTIWDWWKIEQGDPWYSHSTRTASLLKTIIWIHRPKQNQQCR